MPVCPQRPRSARQTHGWKRCGCGSRFEFLETQLQLADLPVQLLRLLTELHALELQHEQLQVVDFDVAREQLGMLLNGQGAQRGYVESL